VQVAQVRAREGSSCFVWAMKTQVVVEIADNGVGMEADVRSRALDAFYSPRRASGLGLTFAALCVRRVGGEILLDSELGVGTSVRLSFPKAEGSRRDPQELN
jgi:signal transduction histidine kinase